MWRWSPTIASATFKPGGVTLNASLTTCVNVYDHTLQVLDEIFSQLEGSGFCTGTKDEDLCNVFLPMATYQGLPLLAEGMIPDTWLLDQVCNQAVSGTCWTRFSNSPIIRSSFLKLSVYKSLFNDCNRVFTNKSFRRATLHLKCQMLDTSQINQQIVLSFKQMFNASLRLVENILLWIQQAEEQYHHTLCYVNGWNTNLRFGKTVWITSTYNSAVGHFLGGSI